MSKKFKMVDQPGPPYELIENQLSDEEVFEGFFIVPLGLALLPGERPVRAILNWRGEPTAVMYRDDDTWHWDKDSPFWDVRDEVWLDEYIRNLHPEALIAHPKDRDDLDRYNTERAHFGLPRMSAIKAEHFFE